MLEGCLILVIFFIIVSLFVAAVFVGMAIVPIIITLVMMLIVFGACVLLFKGVLMLIYKYSGLQYLIQKIKRRRWNGPLRH